MDPIENMNKDVFPIENLVIFQPVMIVFTQGCKFCSRILFRNWLKKNLALWLPFVGDGTVEVIGVDHVGVD